MRLPFVLVALAISASAASAGPASQSTLLFRPAPSGGPSQAETRAKIEAWMKACRRPTNYRADNQLEWRGDRLTPRKLTELPPATAYMAVYRTIDGCEVPLTVVEYRRGRSR